MEHALVENINIRVSRELKDALAALAERDHRTISNHARYVLIQHVQSECNTMPNKSEGQKEGRDDH